MSKNKRPSPANDIYLSHLFGGRTAYNPNTTRTGAIERMYVRILTELATGRFEWKGLPDTVSPRYLELALFNRALSVFYDDRDVGYLALSGSPQAQMNHYADPLAFQVYGANNSLSKIISAKECVPIWANNMRIPDLDIVGIYATRMAELDRTVEINSLNARRNKVMSIPENRLLTAENIERQIQEGNAVIKLSNTFDINELVQALDLSIDPKMITELHVLRTRQFNECMGMLGINNSNQDKKERLVESEVGANDDQISFMRRVNLNQRQIACEKINKMFKLNISVDFYKEPLPDVGELTPADNQDNPKELESDNER